MESSGTRIGTEIAGFRIESVLGRGGMSVVYLAEQTRLGRKVALKVLAMGLVERDEHFRNRFLQESHIAASLDHPNIIPIYDAGEDNDCLYIAMRYVEGRDLSHILREEGALGLGRTLFILEQVASALDAAHERGLVHRDVKPANVLLIGETDRVYLTDFGVAKPTTSAGLTRTGFFIGTPDYSAPEQIEGKDVDARTDVYALGAVLYSCLTGLAPYARDTEVAVLQAHLLEPPPKIRDQRPDLPRGLDRVIATAMAKSKDDRYATCGDLLEAAQSAAHERPSAPPVAASTVLATPTPETDGAEGPAETVLATETTSPAGATAEALAAATAAGAGTVPTVASPPEAPPADTAAAQAPPTEPPTQAPPPQAPVGETASGGGPPRKHNRLLIGVLVVAIVALVAALAAVLATRGGGSSSSNGSTKGTTFNVPLSSSAEVPTSVSTSSSGTANVTIDGTKVCWAFTLHGVDNPSAAHIHNGGPTVSGPVVVPLGAAFAQSGCTTAPENVTNAILASPTSYYVNVHSAKYPDGAVRGQLAGGGTKAGPTGKSTTQHAVGLVGIVPHGIFQSCTAQATPDAGAVETADCVPPANSTSFYPDHLQLSTYLSSAALLRAYNAKRAAAGVGTNFGRCDRTSWGGEGPWVHPSTPPKPGGRRFCYFDGNNAVMVWAHEKLGQPTHVDFLGIAKEGGSDHARLFSWWNFWIHLMGKCLQEGCTASAK
jgi:predicted Ser/Thr protein kinase